MPRPALCVGHSSPHNPDVFLLSRRGYRAPNKRRACGWCSLRVEPSRVNHQRTSAGSRSLPNWHATHTTRRRIGAHSRWHVMSGMATDVRCLAAVALTALWLTISTPDRTSITQRHSIHWPTPVRYADTMTGKSRSLPAASDATTGS